MKNILIIAAVAFAAWYFIKKKPGQPYPLSVPWSGVSGLFKSVTADSSATSSDSPTTAAPGVVSNTQTAVTGDGTTTTAPSDGATPGTATFTKIINRRIK